MKQLLERIRSGKLWQYAGGVFPAERKHYSNKSAISQAIIPSELVIPVSQHLGEPADILVKVGDYVEKGQPLTACNNFRALPVHASSSGTIKAIELRPSCHASGIFEQAIVIQTDGQEKWRVRQPRTDITSLDKHQLIDIVHQAGIAGKGGAGFPAHLKLSGKADIEVLIINGIECEPYITSDDVLMREYAKELFQGIEVLEKITQCSQTIIAVEHNKPEAAKALSAYATDKRQVKVVPTKYPTGGEKQLIEVLTGLQVPATGYAIDMGILMHNVGTTLAIKRAVYDDEPLISRIVTMTGQAILAPGNRHVLIGTPIEFMLQQHQFKPTSQPRVIIGGPMMGFTLPNFQAPVIKTTNCILAPTEAELPLFGQERACIRCGECADACPADLLPQQLYWYAKSQDHEKLDDYNLFDCIECGACAYVCPSEIPLVQYYRVAKAEIKNATVEADKAEVARKRHEARAERLARDKQEREVKHKAAADKRKAQLKQKAESEQTEQTNDAVAQALARAKQNKPQDAGGEDALSPAEARKLRKEQARAAKAAKQAQQAETSDSPSPTGDNVSPVAAAIARAKAKKAKAQGESIEPAASDNDTTPTVEGVEQAADDTTNKPTKNPAVAAAIARAKAKKAKAQGELVEPAASDDDATVTVEDGAQTPDDTAKKPSKNPAVAAAIARAKAKKAKAQGESIEPTTSDEDATATVEDGVKAADDTAKKPSKNPAVAAAIARAKAKKAAKAQSEAIEPAASDDDITTSVEDGAQAADDTAKKPSKNPAVAAAIARAKAKKAAKAESIEPAAADNETASSAEDGAQTPDDTAKKPSKNPTVAAAIARAKAKKAAKAESIEPTTANEDTASSAEDGAQTPDDTAKKPSKNPAVAAAIARAKAKKAAKAQQTQSATEQDTAQDNEQESEHQAPNIAPSSQENHAQESQAPAEANVQVETSKTASNDADKVKNKSAAVAAAIAKAKAKKAQKKENDH